MADRSERAVEKKVQRHRAREWKAWAEQWSWIAAAAMLLYYGDGSRSLYHIVTNDPRIRSYSFRLGVYCLAGNVAIFFYLAIWLRHVRHVADPWEKAAPGAIPAATVLGLIATCMFLWSLWPVWGVLTPVVLFVLFMGFLMFSPYLPPYTKQKREPEGPRID